MVLDTGEDWERGAKPPTPLGFPHLRRLNLASNDLVQFDQWRALETLPRLEHLSLASNRIKRLKDDHQDAHAMMFATLMSLNLSNNEIPDPDSLALLHSFANLTDVNLNGNPVVNTPAIGDLSSTLPSGLMATAEPSKPAYFATKGCYQARAKIVTKVERQPTRSTRLNRRVLAHNKVDEAIRFPGSRSSILPPEDWDWEGNDTFLTTADPGAHDVLDDGLEPEQLDEIFAERRAYIDRVIQTPSMEPQSFMKPLPASLSEGCRQKLATLKNGGASALSDQKKSAHDTTRKPSADQRSPEELARERAVKRRERLLQAREAREKERQAAVAVAEAQLEAERQRKLAAEQMDPREALLRNRNAGEQVSLTEDIKQASRVLHAAMQGPVAYLSGMAGV